MRGAALNLSAKLLTIALSFGVMTIVARQGPHVQGAFALFAAIESALLSLGSGPGLWLAREVSRPESSLPHSVWTAWRWAIGGGVAIGVILALVSLVAPVTDHSPYRWLWLLGMAAPFLLLSNVATCLWLGRGALVKMNAPSIAVPALALGGMLADVAVFGHASVLSIFTIWVVAKITVGIVVTALTWRETAWAKPEFVPTDVAAWRFVGMIGLTNLISLANYRASLFLVEHFLGLSVTGVYSIAVQIAELLWLLSSSITLSAYHRIGVDVDRRDAIKTTLQVTSLNIFVTALAAPLVWLATTFVLPHWLGAEYAAASMPLLWLLPGIVAYAGASSLSAFFTHHLGKPQWSSRIAGLSLTIGTGLGLCLIPAWGVTGAAVATSVAYVMAMGVALRRFFRLTSKVEFQKRPGVL